MKYRLGINTGFAVNRYSEHSEWTRIVGETLGLRYVQLTADILNPDLPGSVLKSHTREILKGCNDFDTSIISTFTGAFTRVNHLAHPDPEVRAHWISWFKRFVDLSVDLGAESMGSHFGIFTAKDDSDPSRRNERRKQNIDGWHQIAAYAKQKGLKYLSWEPMSITREQGETLESARALQSDVNQNSALPILITLDVDHGDLSSQNPDDTDPYAWLRTFAADSPLIHLKQSSKNKSGHWPFTKERNLDGLIQPEQVLSTLEQAHTLNKNPKFETTTLLLELSFRERQPTDSTVISVLEESVNFWRSTVSQ